MIEQTLKQLIPSQDEELFQAAHYSLEGGKRLRPQLTLAVIDAFKVPIEKGLQPACALEMIHAYSLIHDDLPCMDDDDMRRGKPSLHIAFSQSTAILTGDFLLTYAFEVLSNAPHLLPTEKIALITILAKRSGQQGMIGGQMLDIAKKIPDPKLLLNMHLKKTGALITAALEFGAILTNQELAPFQTIGENLGLAFQLIDDLLDEDGMTLILGKAKTQELAKTYYNQALEEINRLRVEAEKLKELASKMIHREV